VGAQPRGLLPKATGAHYLMTVRYQYQGIQGLKAISTTFNIPISTLYDRVNTMGMSIEQAIKSGDYRKAPYQKKLTPDALWDLA